MQLYPQQISAPKINSAYINCVQSINGIFPYYARKVDPTMLLDLNKISICQSAPTQDTIEEYNQVLDHASTHPNATIRYQSSNIILMTETDVAYLVLPESRSCIASALSIILWVPPLKIPYFGGIQDPQNSGFLLI